MAVFLIKEPRAVFIHIPKTGGTSIRHGFFAGNVEGPKQGFVPPNWQRLFKFAFVRNPYDRLISAWKMFASGMEQSVWQHPQDRAGIELKRFLEIVTDESVSYEGIRETTEQKIRHHAIPQTHPFNCLEHADFIGRFETINEDFANICSQLGIEESDLPHWNRTERSNEFMQYFDNETLLITNDFFASDFESLGYETITEL